MSTSTGELREILIDCIEQVKSGKMSGADAKAVAMLAGQVTLSLQVEVNARRDEALKGKQLVGSLELGEISERVVTVAADSETEPDYIDAVPSAVRAPWPGAVTVHKIAG
jgi:hypothetical protein